MSVAVNPLEKLSAVMYSDDTYVWVQKQRPVCRVPAGRPADSPAGTDVTSWRFRPIPRHVSMGGMAVRLLFSALRFCFPFYELYKWRELRRGRGWFSSRHDRSRGAG